MGSYFFSRKGNCPCKLAAGKYLRIFQPPINEKRDKKRRKKRAFSETFFIESTAYLFKVTGRIFEKKKKTDLPCEIKYVGIIQRKFWSANFRLEFLSKQRCISLCRMSTGASPSKSQLFI